jgi:hypothetical protein
MIDAQKRENETLKKRNKSLVESTAKARSDLREERRQSTAVEKEYKQKVFNLEDEVYHVSKSSNAERDKLI